MSTKAVRDKADKAAPSAVVNRRALLTGTAVVAAASSVVLVEQAEAFHATPEETAPRYKESEHVKTFYRLAGR